MKVYVTRSIPDRYVEKMKAAAEVTVWDGGSPVPRDVLLREVSDIDGLFCMLTDGIDGELLDSAPDLRVVSQMSVGLDNIDIDACLERGIRVGHTPDVLTGTVADHAFALLLAVARRLPEGRQEVVDGDWGTWDPWHLLGMDAHETVLGIVGMGRVGNAVARRAIGFGMEILYTSRRASGEVGRLVSFDALLGESDHIVISAPLTDESRGMFDARAFQLMKPTATLVNVARGPLVDSDDLVAALTAGEIFGAGLDVTDPEPIPGDHPLLTLPNCLVVPHIASASTRTRHRMADRTVDNLLAGLSSAPMPSEVLRH